MKRLFVVLFFLIALASRNPLSAQWAVVDVSVCNLRLAPDYESSNETQALMGTLVQVLDADRYWRKVSTPDPYVAWTNDLALAYMDEQQKDAYIAAPKWMCVADFEYVYDSPDMESARLCDICTGCLLLKGEDRHKDWLAVVLPDGTPGWVRESALEDFDKWLDSRELTGEALVSVAEKYNGAPYVWGGISPKGFDCSGLVKTAYMQCGVLLPRNACEQVLCGEAVDIADMLPGDLIFYGRRANGDKPLRITHVAMYIGGGRIIHSSQKVRICSLHREGKDPYVRDILAVRRIIGHVDTGEGVISMRNSTWYK